MDRDLALPALVLLDEVGAGTDPVEGGALGIAVIDHFRQRGAHLVATTHYDSLKSYASTTEGVDERGVRLQPGDVRADLSADLRIARAQPGDRNRRAARACRRSVIAAARENLSEREKQLAEHLARVDQELRRLEQERRTAGEGARGASPTSERKLRAREESVREREDTLPPPARREARRSAARGRREIDTVIEGLKATRRPSCRDQAAATQRAASISTGETGAVRADARAALERRRRPRCKNGTEHRTHRRAVRAEPQAPIERRSRASTVGGLGLEGVVVEIHGKQAEIDVRGKRLRAPLRDLRAIGGGSHAEQRCRTSERQRRSAAARGIAVRVERDRLHRGRSDLTRAREVPRRIDRHRSAESAYHSRPRHRPAAPRRRRVPEGPSARRAVRCWRRPNQGGGGVDDGGTKD